MTKAQFSSMPPKEAVKFFKNKGYAFSFDWREVWKEEHAIAFTVAKVSTLDILQDIRGEVQKAIEQGLTFESFKKNLKPLLVDKGWWGRAIQKDPLTGAEKEVQLGSTRRLQTIWRTNADMAYAAGNWQHIQDTRKTHPYLKYRCSMLENSREQHKLWNNIMLPADDPWWDTHYPPNGWNCRCWVQQIAKHSVTSGQEKVSRRPKEDFELYRNKRTGESVPVPKGIAPGFDYNVGKARARAYTPPPLGGVPQTCQNRTAQLPPLPKPDKLPSSPLLPSNLSDEEYMNAFFKEFGIKSGETTYFTDKSGDILPINQSLFIGKDGANKVNKNNRGQYMRLLALGVIEPDEIWLQWVKTANGGWLLKKRFIKLWEADKGSHCLSIFDRSLDGWQGATVFPPASGRSSAQRDKYINKYRDGLLLYKKSSE